MINIRQKLSTFFPILIFIIFINLFIDGERFKLDNVTTVLSVFILSSLLINRETFLFNRNSIIVLLFLFVFFFSSIFAENMLISLKRFIIVFVPFFIIFQTFQNHKNPDFINKSEKYLLSFILFLCSYSLIVFTFDLVYSFTHSRELALKINEILSSNTNNLDNQINSIESHFIFIMKKIILLLNQHELNDQTILHYEVSTNNIFTKLKTSELPLNLIIEETFKSSQSILRESLITPWEVSKNVTWFGQIYTSRYDFNFDFKWLRPSSLMSNTIGFSNLLIIGISLLMTKKYLNQLPKLLVIVILYIFLIWTLARFNIVIATLLLPLLIFAINHKRILLFLFITKFIIILIFILIMSFDLTNVILNINDIFYYKASDLDNLKLTYIDKKLVLGNIHDRFDIIRLSLLDIKQFLISGVGFGTNYENFLLEKLDSLELHSHLKTVVIPSVPITILTETGLIGFVAYISILPILIQKINFTHSKQKSILFLLFVIYTTQYFDISLFRFHPLTFLFAFYLGIILNKNLKSHG